MSDKILFTLSKIAHALTSHVKQELKKDKIVLSPGQIGILLSLERERQTTMGQLSQSLEMDNAAASRLVDKLEKKGLVERFINPEDRRQIKISITDQGLKQARVTQKIANDMTQKIQEGFTEKEMDTYTRINQAIINKFK